MPRVPDDWVSPTEVCPAGPGGAAVPGLAQGLIRSMIFQRLPTCQVLGWDRRSLTLGSVESGGGR